MKMYFFMLVLAISLFTACENQEIGNSKDVNPETVFQSYNIGFTEGDTAVEFIAQFRFGGVNGTTLVLNNGSNVALDSNQLKVDSTDFMGAFYKTVLPAPSAESKHVITFQDINGKTYTNKFSIKPFILLNHFEEPLAAGELVLNFSGSNDNLPIQIAIEDTTKASIACDTVVKPKNGKIVLPPNFMNRLSPGPVAFHILQKQTLPLQEYTKEGGQLDFTYELKKVEAKLEVSKLDRQFLISKSSNKF